MSKNPINYTVRFILELVGLYAFGLWGWQATDNTFLRIILAVGLPVLAATAWGVFGTVGDSRGQGGKPPIAVPGWIRLAVEVAYLALAAGAFIAAGAATAGLIFGLVAFVQTALTYDRIGWLLSH